MRTSITGKTVYQGQDSRPYADNDLLIVADGLGGRGGFPHTAMDRRILNKDEIYDVLFCGEEPVFTDDVGDDFKDFVINNFEELFLTKQYYEEGKDYVRRSGYFASRIVVAIVLHELKYNPRFNKEAIFESIKDADGDTKDAIAAEIGSDLAVIVKEKLMKVAKNGNFELEVNSKGAYLLPTTLTVGLLNERENDVEVLYLWAGDSRGYTWSIENGMRQVTEDHEQDETMTNNISLSRDFTIEGRFLTVKRPCAIFLASDGVYKPPAFLCPIDQEVMLLNAVLGNPDEESAIKQLVNDYNNYSPDDSSTLALKSYDYTNYDELKAAFAERMNKINEDYVAKLPGILNRDYSGELARLEAPLMNKLGEISEELVEIDGIFEIVKLEMTSKRYAPYLEELEALKELSTKSPTEEREEIKNKIRQLICDNWISGPWLRLTSPVGRTEVNGIHPTNKHNEHKRSLREAKEEYRERLTEISLMLRKVSNKYIHPLCKSIDTFETLAAYGEDVIDRIPEAKNTIYECVDEVFENIRSVVNGTDEIVIAYRNKLAEMQEYVKAVLDNDREVIDETVMAAIENPESILGNCKSDGWKEELVALCEEYKNVKEIVLPTEEEIARKHAPAFLNGNTRLYGLIWNSHRHLVPETLVDKLVGDDEELRAKRAEYRDALEIREQLYNEYNDNYKADYRSSRI